MQDESNGVLPAASHGDMSHRAAMIKITSEEFHLLAGYIHEECGVILDESKTYLLESRLSSLAQQLGCDNFREMYHRIRADLRGELKLRMLDAVTTQETSFFRDRSPFELLRFKIIPDHIDRSNRLSGRKELNVWSAACSTGQEVYSIAVVAHEMLCGYPGYKVRILGTDISESAIVKAGRGLYSELEISRGFPPEKIGRYFTREGKDYKIRDELRAMAHFERRNLLQPFYPHADFDIIFCRNVAIYFGEKDRRSLFSRLADRLAPGGFLIVGSTESLRGVCPGLERHEYHHTVCYRFNGKKPAE